MPCQKNQLWTGVFSNVQQSLRTDWQYFQPNWQFIPAIRTSHNNWPPTPLRPVSQHKITQICRSENEWSVFCILLFRLFVSFFSASNLVSQIRNASLSARFPILFSSVWYALLCWNSNRNEPLEIRILFIWIALYCITLHQLDIKSYKKDIKIEPQFSSRRSSFDSYRGWR